ncbi:MAG: OB-fold domain-containing protein [Deltaproteobacteria bacterium]|nr:OB-fold domain-containing protein [Deltaproteobacteria bacterium]
MTSNDKKQVPVRPGLWTTPAPPEEKPQLTGSECTACGEVFFPKREKGVCIRCGHRGLKDVKLDRRGKIHSFSVIMQQPTKFFLGQAPYAYGWVNLPNVRVQALFTGGDFNKLRIGLPVELVIEALGVDEEGNEVLAHKFRPVQE